MDTARTITITVDPDTASALEAAVAAGEHASVEAAAAAAIDEWWADRVVEAYGVERVREMLREGAESGPGLDGEEVFRELIAKYERMADERGE